MLKQQFFGWIFFVGCVATLLCVSYDCTLEITNTIYENLCELYSLYHCFFPNILKKGLFTIMLKDSIDINAKSTFVKSHYHGTSLSMVQYTASQSPQIIN